MIQVTLPDKQYRIEIQAGLRHAIGEQVAKVWSKRKVLLISDEHVASYYFDVTAQNLALNGFEVVPAVLPAGEQTKSLEAVNYLVGVMAENGFTRQDGVIALGGGVIGDTAGFVASVYMRGIAFIQVATSLTAQVDSSVGGKNAINMDDVKNIMGTFYQPDLVIIDPEYLDTLDDRDLIEGYAEVVKTSALAGGEFWQWTGRMKTVADVRANAQWLIEQSVQYKADIVMADEKEGGIRKVLNFGHTFGHAIELMAHGELRHGEAVAVGMVTISDRFERDGNTESGLTDALVERLAPVGLPVFSPLIGQDDFYDHLKNDKKNQSGTLQSVALVAPGEPVIVKKELAAMKEFVEGNPE